MNLQPAIDALLMRTASHDHDEAAVKELLTEFNTRAKCETLANEIAHRTAERATFIPRPGGTLTTEQLMALVAVRACKRGEPIGWHGLSDATVSSVTIALLTTWRAACVARAVADTSSRPWEALHSPADALQGGFGG